MAQRQASTVPLEDDEPSKADLFAALATATAEEPLERWSLKRHQSSTELEQQNYDRERRRRHLAGVLPTIDHPLWREVATVVDDHLDDHRDDQTPDRGGFAVTGESGVGKTRLGEYISYRHYNRMIEPGPPALTGNPPARHIPVVTVIAPASGTLIDLADAIIDFLGLPKSRGRATFGDRERRIARDFRRCRVTLLVIDECHAMHAVDSAKRTLLVFLRGIQAKTQATVLLLGIDLDKEELYLREKDERSGQATQIGRRFPLLPLTTYPTGDVDGEEAFRATVFKLSSSFVLLREAPERLDAYAEDLHKLSGGVMLKLTTIIGDAANAAIRDGTERWSKERFRKAASRIADRSATRGGRR